MDKRLRPVPFKWGTQAYRTEYRRLRAEGNSDYITRHMIRHANNQARQYSFKEKCGATTRRGTPCQAPAVWWRSNGRCKLHGGLSTSAKTPEGKARSLANLKQYRNNPLLPKFKVE